MDTDIRYAGSFNFSVYPSPVNITGWGRMELPPDTALAYAKYQDHLVELSRDISPTRFAMEQLRILHEEREDARGLPSDGALGFIKVEQAEFRLGLYNAQEELIRNPDLRRQELDPKPPLGFVGRRFQRDRAERMRRLLEYKKAYPCKPRFYFEGEIDYRGRELPPHGSWKIVLDEPRWQEVIRRFFEKRKEDFLEMRLSGNIIAINQNTGAVDQIYVTPPFSRLALLRDRGYLVEHQRTAHEAFAEWASNPLGN